MPFKKTLLFFIIFVFKGLILSSQTLEMIDISTKNGLISPKENILFCEDETNSLKIEDIIKRDFQSGHTPTSFFKNYKKENLNFGFTNTAIWLKIIVWNNSDIDTEKILEFNNKDLDFVELYSVDENNKILRQNAGDLRTTFETNEKGFFPTFRVKINANTSQIHYLRLKSSSPIQFEMRFWDEISYLNFLNFNIRFLWFFIGILILRIFFSVSIHRFVEATAFKFYTLSIIVFLLGAILNSIQLRTYLAFPPLTHFITNVFYFLIPLALSLWLYHFLYLSKQKIIFYIIYGFGLLGILSLAVFRNHHFPILLSNIYIIVVHLFLLFNCLKSYSVIPKNNRIFLVASILPIIICMIYPAINLSILNFKPIFIILITFFTLIEAIFIPIYLGRFIFKNHIQNPSKNIISESKNVVYELKPKAVEELSSDEALLLQIKEIIEKNLQNSQFGIEDLCTELNTTPTQLRRKLKTLIGLTTIEFIRQIRLNRAAELLSKKVGTISEIGYQVGFENMSYFSKMFQAQFGVLPSEYS